VKKKIIYKINLDLKMKITTKIIVFPKYFT